MPKFMETKQIIHIASEIVVLVALTVYFTQKNKRLSKHIQELAERLEQQEDVIQRHEQVIRKMVNLINSMGPKHPQTQNPQTKNHVKPSYTKRSNKHPSPTGLPPAQITIHTQGPPEPRHGHGPGFNPLAAIFGARPPPRPSPMAHVDIEEVSDSESESSVSESESEEKLDADLEDELEELTEAVGESDLKPHEQDNKKENGNE